MCTGVIESMFEPGNRRRCAESLNLLKKSKSTPRLEFDTGQYPNIHQYMPSLGIVIVRRAVWQKGQTIVAARCSSAFDSCARVKRVLTQRFAVHTFRLGHLQRGSAVSFPVATVYPQPGFGLLPRGGIAEVPDWSSSQSAVESHSANDLATQYETLRVYDACLTQGLTSSAKE